MVQRQGRKEEKLEEFHLKNALTVNQALDVLLENIKKTNLYKNIEQATQFKVFFMFEIVFTFTFTFYTLEKIFIAQ